MTITETFLVVPPRGRSATGIQWIEVRHVANCPEITGQSPMTKGYLAPNVNDAQLEEQPVPLWLLPSGQLGQEP